MSLSVLQRRKDRATERLSERMEDCFIYPFFFFFHISFLPALFYGHSSVHLYLHKRGEKREQNLMKRALLFILRHSPVLFISLLHSIYVLCLCVKIFFFHFQRKQWTNIYNPIRHCSHLKCLKIWYALMFKMICWVSVYSFNILSSYTTVSSCHTHIH